MISENRKIPLAQEGEAIYHIAIFEDHEEVADPIEQVQEMYELEDGTSLEWLYLSHNFHVGWQYKINSVFWQTVW